MSDNYVRYIKVKIKHSLGVRRGAEVTGTYTSKALAVASQEPGEIYSAAKGYTLVKELNEKL